MELQAAKYFLDKIFSTAIKQQQQQQQLHDNNDEDAGKITRKNNLPPVCCSFHSCHPNIHS